MMKLELLETLSDLQIQKFKPTYYEVQTFFDLMALTHNLELFDQNHLIKIIVEDYITPYWTVVRYVRKKDQKKHKEPTLNYKDKELMVKYINLCKRDLLESNPFIIYFVCAITRLCPEAVSVYWRRKLNIKNKKTQNIADKKQDLLRKTAIDWISNLSEMNVFDQSFEGLWKEAVYKDLTTLPPFNTLNYVDSEKVQRLKFLGRHKYAQPLNDHVFDDMVFGCECEGECTDLKTCICLQDTEMNPYDENDKVKDECEKIHECNSKCRCNTFCKLRNIQNSPVTPDYLYVKKTIDKGWGVFTKEPIKKGTYVCEYVGELKTCKLMNLQQPILSFYQMTYGMDLDYGTDGKTENIIDAVYYCNISRFFNHSCEPNLRIIPVKQKITKFFEELRDLNFQRIGFFTNRNIEPEEEITFDYHCDMGDCRCRTPSCRAKTNK